MPRHLQRILQILKGEHTCLTSGDRHALGRVSSVIQALKAKAAGIQTEPPKPQLITVRGEKQP